MTRVPLFWRAAGVLVAGALAAATATTPASGATGRPAPDATMPTGAVGAIEQADPAPAGFRSWPEAMAVQARLNEAADQIVAATASAGGETGFAGLIAAPENRELRLYWKGSPPPPIATLLGRLRRDIPVSLLRAPHSQRELQAQADQTMRRGRSTLSFVAPRVDGSGLTVAVRGGSPDAVQRLADIVSAAAAEGIPVTVQAGVSPVMSSRWNDFSPWWGGGSWINVTRGNGCSTGFAVSHQGRTKILSAGHCAQLGDHATDPTAENIGLVTQDNNAHDALLIDARAEGNVYNNDASLNEFRNPVVGAQGSYVGNWVCTSGAYSGTRCGIQVTQTGVSIMDNTGAWVGPLVVAEKSDHTSASGTGDSGGPIEQTAADPTRVYAKGTITAGDGSTVVACTGYVITGRICSWRMYYADILTTMNAFGASIVNG